MAAGVGTCICSSPKEEVRALIGSANLTIAPSAQSQSCPGPLAAGKELHRHSPRCGSSGSGMQCGALIRGQ